MRGRSGAQERERGVAGGGRVERELELEHRDDAERERGHQIGERGRRDVGAHATGGLIGFELDHSFQVGVGVNLMPDPQSPSHMIVAAGWTPRVGAIQTPIHFFYVPDANGNNRTGATVGMNW